MHRLLKRAISKTDPRLITKEKWPGKHQRGLSVVGGLGCKGTSRKKIKSCYNDRSLIRVLKERYFLRWKFPGYCGFWPIKQTEIIFNLQIDPTAKMGPRIVFMITISSKEISTWQNFGASVSEWYLVLFRSFLPFTSCLNCSTNYRMVFTTKFLSNDGKNWFSQNHW